MDSDNQGFPVGVRNLQLLNDKRSKALNSCNNVLYTVQLQGYLIFLSTPTSRPSSPSQNTVYGFHFESQKWFNIKSPKLFSIECGASVCPYGKNIILIYGGESSLHSDTDTSMQVLSLKENEKGFELDTYQLSLGQYMPRSYHSANYFERKMFIFGGYAKVDSRRNKFETDELSSIELKSHSSLEITRNHRLVPYVKQRNRAEHFSQVIGENLYIWGGCRNKSEMNSVQIINLRTKTLETFEMIEKLDLYQNNLNHSVITKGQILIFRPGGIFSRYDIATGEYYEEIFKLEEVAKTSFRLQKMVKFNEKVLFVSEQSAIFTSSFESLEGDQSSNEVSFDGSLDEINFDSPRPNVNINKKLYEEKLHSDVVFIVENKSFPAHKNILSAASSYFKNMFSSGMSESSQKEIAIPEMKANCFEAFLKYVYCNETNLNEEIAMDLIVYCEKILFPNLKIECEKVLARRIGMNNVFVIYDTAEVAKAEKLKEVAVRFIRRNIKEITKKIGIENLSKSLLIELVEDKFL